MNDPFFHPIGGIVDGVPHAEYILTHAHAPWYLTVSTNRKGLTLDRYPDLIGSHFTFYPSLPLFPAAGYRLDGEDLPFDAFSVVKTYNGTGSSLICLEPNHGR